MKTINAVWLIVLLVSAPLWPTQAHAQHAGDYWIARTAAGQLTLDVKNGRSPASVAELLEISPGGFWEGWSHNSPGFEELDADDPANGYYTLETGAKIWLEVVDCDPAFRLIDDAFQYLDQPGERTFIGDAGILHIHFTWHVNSEDPDYDPDQIAWAFSFKLTDEGATGYDDSAVYTVHFVRENLYVPADLDFDGDVDGQDFLTFSVCYNSALRPPQPACKNLNADLDQDDDVDGQDFLTFSTCYNGALRPPRCP